MRVLGSGKAAWQNFRWQGKTPLLPESVFKQAFTAHNSLPWWFEWECLHRIICLNTWSLVSGSVWEGLGGRSVPLRVGFETLKILVIPPLLSLLCASQHPSLATWRLSLPWHYEYWPSGTISHNKLFLLSFALHGVYHSKKRTERKVAKFTIITPISHSYSDVRRSKHSKNKNLGGRPHNFKTAVLRAYLQTRRLMDLNRGFCTNPTQL